MLSILRFLTREDNARRIPSENEPSSGKDEIDGFPHIVVIGGMLGIEEIWEAKLEIRMVSRMK